MRTTVPMLPTVAIRKAKSAARRLAWRLERAAGPSPAAPSPPPSPELPPQVGPNGSRRPVPLPAGWTRDDVYSLLGSISIDGAPAGEMQSYLDEDFERFLTTWNLLCGAEGAALEIGANPYFTTVLLWTFTTLDLTLTNCFDPAASGEHRQSIAYRNPVSALTVERTVSYESLNIEGQLFPWPDGHFDTIIFAEVIEHLTVDPVASLLEIHRVLKTGGALVVSTPNIARLENVARVIAGANIYDPYSGYGPFGRHNREFTRHELVKLLEFCGFTVEDHFTADVHPHRTELYVDPAVIAPLVSERLDDLGQYVFVRCIKAHTPRPGRPFEIYRSLDPATLHSWD